MFRKGETPEFIAAEFMISGGLRQAVRPGGAFDRFLRREEQAVDRMGFDGWRTHPGFARIVDRVRASVREMDDADAVALVRRLMRDDDPDMARNADAD